MSTALNISTQGGVHTITLSRPDVRNAFNDEVIAELKNAFLAVAQDATVRCVVLAAEGPAFCAGADLNWMRRMADYTRDENLADAGELAAMLRAWGRVHETSGLLQDALLEHLDDQLTWVNALR